ncbi:MAG TPA: hypothetical protein PKW07_03535 [Syntrophorhabdaceae bacterium]|nr:hypothetical protein [Syntrophorhabdaceae bacterium]
MTLFKRDCDAIEAGKVRGIGKGRGKDIGIGRGRGRMDPILFR